MHKELFDQLVQVVATLRGENGCPWDKAQTHETLKSDLIEETYEVIEAIDAKSTDKLQEELGDLLLQVMLNAQIAKDQGDFSINEVVRSITDKLIRRHPHVFGDVDAKDTETVLQNWEAIKRSEAGYEDRNVRPRWRARIPAEPVEGAEDSEQSRPRRVRLGHRRRCPAETGRRD